VKLLYLTMLDFPRRVANRGQIMNMSEAFSKYTNFKLFMTHSYLKRSELYEYYGVEKPFSIVEVNSKKVPGKLRSLLRFFILMATFRPGVVYVREEKLAYLLSLLRIKYVYEIHEIFRANIKRQIHVIGRSLFTVAITSTLVTELDELGVDSEKVVLCNLAVKISSYVDNGDKCFDGIPESNNCVRIVYSGRFSEHKGIYTLIDAVNFLPDNYRLFLIGGFEGEKEIIQNYIEGNSLTEKIEIIGYVKHAVVHKYLKSSDILVLPNSGKAEIMRHTNPLKLYEYLAAGRPIVASDLVSLRDVVSDDIVNYFVADDSIDLARVIKSVTEDKKLSAGKVKNGLEFVRSKSWEARAKKLLQLMDVKIE